MSHFSVGVLVREEDCINLNSALEGILEPFQENNMEDCPEEYLEFFDETETVKTEYEKYLNNSSEYDTNYKSLEDFAVEFFGYSINNGKFGYYENPNAKWDWWQIGGRYSNMLLDKIGVRKDICNINDIDFETMRKETEKEAIQIWDSNPQEIDRYFAGILKTDTRESYIKRVSEFSTYAVIDENGKWHEKGEMGWFGYSSETDEEANKWSDDFEETFIKDKDKDLVLVIVDCHI